MYLETPQTYQIEIAGENFSLPIVRLNDRRAIALLMVIDMGIRFGDIVGNALANHFAQMRPDIVVGSATLGVPVAIEVSRRLGIDQYVILQKSPKFHLADALVEDVRSITTAVPQRLLLDRRSISLLQGKRVLIVDDVIATGSSMAAAIRLVRRAGANIIGAGAILTEGHAWRNLLGEDANLVASLSHIPQFDMIAGVAIPDTTTEKDAWMDDRALVNKHLTQAQRRRSATQRDAAQV
ncbi:adenine phosphoribosyltransferase [Agrobacterium rhizogenes]|uniref:phosphoribosyltransferase family protein n=1 Tax=Rhizobium rhizogenes TaxID=359 RepID=UPI000648E82C|nr:phosphoribosyltransferase family protein [Rhizobium rhizogenes]KAA6487873.1 adenine phosphoribosyltransferase [Agrobacterium sp. ICMP 7243]OCJ23084.1 adenine phosphoribosyltransferase [Agrobacterium sp. B133/95]MDJ1638587.1 phosphoribosyltransferase family protein [Rhizobium rhizogenes]NTF51252.1 adenine phosphoribosyltransferase [Rhizobium rhizogenes]NTG03220.1 adenine phosphoribosyltransferase [Rhizobium rhizogenes]